MLHCFNSFISWSLPFIDWQHTMIGLVATRHDAHESPHILRWSQRILERSHAIISDELIAQPWLVVFRNSKAGIFIDSLLPWPIKDVACLIFDAIYRASQDHVGLCCSTTIVLFFSRMGNTLEASLHWETESRSTDAAKSNHTNHRFEVFEDSGLGTEARLSV